MTDEDIRLLEQTIDRVGTISGDDARLLIAELRRRGEVIVQMQQAIDYAGDTVPGDEEDARAFTKRYLQVIKHQG